MTRRGGGAALPWKTDLFTAIVQTAVKEASRNDIPLTIKMRKGIDDDHITFLESAKIARDAGVAAIALHGRTAAQHYSGKADWDSIAQLRELFPTCRFWATAIFSPPRTPCAWLSRPEWTAW